MRSVRRTTLEKQGTCMDTLSSPLHGPEQLVYILHVFSFSIKVFLTSPLFLNCKHQRTPRLHVHVQYAAKNYLPFVSS
ncbi:hypothetical protein SETIT_2G429700v2 [Setaria italica]|uniref:Uncharacterized protein n=2 Tax=Setaria TaxID=4554 RepID=A0A368Q9D8_SETIT|nr:hypothetical protein SETIT_2G429700v2 [Setaria italica]TKW36475.1 hypothetical protein SEVIR_2G442300v2 [Setaria viridis]